MHTPRLAPLSIPGYWRRGESEPSYNEKRKKKSIVHDAFFLNGVLGLGTSATAVCAVGVTGELDDIRLLKTKYVLEPPTDRLQYLLALCGCASGLVAGNALTHGASPQTDTVEALAHIHDHTHDLVVAVALEGLADGGELCVQPQVVDGDGSLILELVGPLATVLVLGVLPLRSYALLEEVVVGLEAQLGGWRDVVLDGKKSWLVYVEYYRILWQRVRSGVDLGLEATYVDTPEFLDGAECDDLLQQIIPVIALDETKLVLRSVTSVLGDSHLAGGRLGEPEGPLVHKRVLDVEVLGVVENGDRLVG